MLSTTVLIVSISFLPMQVFILNVNLAIMQQWIMPTALNSLEPFRDMDWARMVERALLLAVSVT